MECLRLSVGIPAHNEEGNIGRVLEALLAQELPSWLELEEIVVVASGCTDRTEDVVRDFGERDERVKLVVEAERRGQTSAINKLIRLARGDVVVFMCADTLPSRHALHELVSPMLSSPDVGAVVGRAMPLNDINTFWGFLAHLQYAWMYRPELVAVDFESMTAIRRHLLKPVPEEVMAPELYLDALVRAHGYRVVHAPRALVFTKHPDNIWDYVEQKRRDTFHIMCLRQLGIRVRRRELRGLAALLVDGVRLTGLRASYRLALASAIWAYCYLAALSDALLGRRKRYELWRPLRSTKKLAIGGGGLG